MFLRLGRSTTSKFCQTRRFYRSPTIGGMPDNPLGRLSNGLIFMNGEQHKQQRRLLLPAFHKNHLDTYGHSIIALVDEWLSHWQIGQTRDISKEMRQLTMRVAIKTLFGLNVPEEAEALGNLILQWMALKLSPYSWVLPYNLPGSVISAAA